MYGWMPHSGAASMSALLHELVPGLEPVDVRSDACANCLTPTGLPYIGPVRSGLHVATGGNGLAAKSSDEIGRLAAASALGALYRADPKSSSHSLLAAERFTPVVREANG